MRHPAFSQVTSFLPPVKPPSLPHHYHLLSLTMVLLVTSDNEQFTVEKEVAERSVLIKNMLEGGSLITDEPPTYLTTLILLSDVDVGENDQPIPLPNVSSSVLKKVCITHDMWRPFLLQLRGAKISLTLGIFTRF